MFADRFNWPKTRWSGVYLCIYTHVEANTFRAFVSLDSPGGFYLPRRFSQLRLSLTGYWSEKRREPFTAKCLCHPDVGSLTGETAPFTFHYEQDWPPEISGIRWLFFFDSEKPQRFGNRYSRRGRMQFSNERYVIACEIVGRAFN